MQVTLTFIFVLVCVSASKATEIANSVLDQREKRYVEKHTFAGENKILLRVMAIVKQTRSGPNLNFKVT